MFNFLPLINNSVTIESSFLLWIISVIISSKTINIFFSLSGLCSSIFLQTSCISFEYSAYILCQNPLFYYIHILFHMDLLRTNIFYQCLVDFLLNLIINLFFQILSLLLLIFCMDDLEYLANFYYVWFYFH